MKHHPIKLHYVSRLSCKSKLLKPHSNEDETHNWINVKNEYLWCVLHKIYNITGYLQLLDFFWAFRFWLSQFSLYIFFSTGTWTWIWRTFSWEKENKIKNWNPLKMSLLRCTICILIIYSSIIPHLLIYN